jgi:hypothetical protein
MSLCFTGADLIAGKVLQDLYSPYVVQLSVGLQSCRKV